MGHSYFQVLLYIWISIPLGFQLQRLSGVLFVDFVCVSKLCVQLCNEYMTYMFQICLFMYMCVPVCVMGLEGGPFIIINVYSIKLTVGGA